MLFVKVIERIVRAIIMVTALALILHLTVAEEGPISYAALEQAIAWAEYLEPHARRIYAPGISPDWNSPS